MMVNCFSFYGFIPKVAIGGGFFNFFYYDSLSHLVIGMIHSALDKF